MQKTIISLIAAMAENRVIGKDNDMPWGRLPADLKHFRAATQGHTVIMGRKTFESIGKPLPKRRNIVITSKKEIPGCEVATSIKEAISMSEGEEEVFIIGGGSIYKQTLMMADRLYITEIDMQTEGDTFFPEYKQLNLSEMAKYTSPKDDENAYSTIYTVYAVDKCIKINIEVNGKEDFYSYLTPEGFLHDYRGVGFPDAIAMYTKDNYRSTSRDISIKDITKITAVITGEVLDKNKLHNI